MKKILVISAHPDDEVLGCGGTLLNHKNNKDEIHILHVFEGVSGRYRNKNDQKIKDEINIREKSAKNVASDLESKSVNFLRYPNLKMNDELFLTLTKDLFEHINKIKPDTIYTHSSTDLNRDHRLCNEAVLVSTRPMKNSYPNEILAFNAPSSTEWSFNTFGFFNGKVYVDISNSFEKKIDLIKRYDYELRPYPHPRSMEAIKARAVLFGSEIGFNFAEKFELIRSKRK